MSNLITVMAGVLIVVTGVILAGAGIALGLQAAMPTIPPWVFFLVIGAVALVLGLGLMYFGKQRTVKSVENTLTMKQSFQDRPFVMAGVVLGLGFLIGLIVKRVRASQSATEKAKRQVAAFTDAQIEDVLAKQKPWWQRKLQQAAFSGIASLLAIGFRVYGVPLLQDMLARFSGTPESARAAHHNGETSEEHERYSQFNSAHR